MRFYIIFITTDYKLRSSEGVLAALPDIDNLLDYGDCLFFFSLGDSGPQKITWNAAIGDILEKDTMPKTVKIK